MNVGKISFGPAYMNSTLGFDSIFDDMNRFLETGISKTTNYPPHNIIRKDNNYVVEVAAAGFTQDQIDINLENGYLTVSGEKKEKDSEVSFIYKGIGTRNFYKTFKISDTVQVIGAEFVNGILRIHMENIIPEHQKPRKILIGSVGETKPQLLTE